MSSLLAPLESLSNIVPSLDSSPKKSVTMSNEYSTVPISPQPDEKNEVKFDFDDISSLSSSSSSLTTEGTKNKPKIPDGGWGWMIVLASLILSMIADGISLSFGLLYVEFLNEFGASKSVTSWIGSLFMAVPLVTGPIMSALVDKYGCRSMTIVGGLISAMGFIISSRINSIGVMFLTFGVLSGLGLGLAYVTAVVSVAFWFDKKRSLAVGLGAAGTGIGTFVYSPFTTFLIKEFGWRGTTLILAGSFLNMCVCGALMRDPDWIIEQNRQNSKLTKSSKSSKTSLVSIASTLGNMVDINEIKSLLKSGKDAEYVLQNLETSMESSKMLSSKDSKNFQSVVNLPTFIKQNEKVPIEVLEQLSSNKKLYHLILENYPALLLCRSTSEKGLDKMAEDASLVLDRIPVKVSVKLQKTEKNKKPSAINDEYRLPQDHLEFENPLLEGKEKPKVMKGNNSSSNPPPRTNSFPWLRKQFATPSQHQSYFKNIKIHRQSLVHRTAIFSTHKYRIRASSCPNIYRVSMTELEGEEKWYSEFVELIKNMFDFSLFLEFHFLLFSLSTVVLYTWFVIPYFYLADNMLMYDYTEEQASFTVSVIGVANTIGMIALGWAGDQPWMNITLTYSICTIFCGLSCVGMMFFADNYILLETSAAMFGIFLSSSFSFTPGILVELVPLERFTVAYGLQLLCMGIGNLLGPPIAGLLFDITGTWEQSFYQAGFWTCMSGVLIAIIPYTKNRKLIGLGPVEKVLAKK